MLLKLTVRAILTISVFAPLAGCYGVPIDQMTYSQKKAMMLRVAKSCEAQGYGQKTAEFQDCYKQEYVRQDSLGREAQYIRMNHRGPTICNQFGAMTVCN